MHPAEDYFTLDPVLREQRKAEQMRRLHAQQIPWLRLAGFVLLSGIAVLGDVSRGVALPSPQLLVLCAINIGYAVLSALLLRRSYGRTGTLDLSLLLMHLDVVVWLFTLHHLEQIHLFFGYLLLSRVADQVGFGFRRALYFAHVVVLAYLGYALWLSVVDPPAARWSERLPMAGIMYVVGVYLSLTGLVTERLRARMRAAVRTARGLVDTLEQRTQELQAQADELQRAREAAEQASVAKSRFLAVMSHEVRTPLNGLLGAAELLQATDLNAQQRRLTDITMSSGHTLLGIIDDVLDLARIEAGTLAVRSQPFELQALVDDAIAAVRTQADKKGLVLSAQIGPGLPQRLVGDALRVRQVLSNLLGNAVKFTERGSVELKVSRIELALASRGLGLRFTVIDTGIGIAAHKLGQIFEPFTQADSRAARRHGGSGLGLSIARHMAALMGGRIGVLSEPGRGSSFWFEAPFQVAPVSSAAPDQEPINLPVRELQVLLAEDNGINQTVLKEMLLRLGCAVDIAADGAAAVAATEAKRYDLVFMDCHMPGIDGYEATRRIRAAEAASARHTPIVALTAAAMPEDRAACIASGMDDFLSKPATIGQLGAALNRWIQADTASATTATGLTA